jgi:phosphoribosylglycinamide formyltransferase-1
MGIKIAVLASGRGSNFQSILDAIERETCDAEAKLLISDKPDAPAIERAKKRDIPVEIVERKDFDSRESMDERILELLKQYGVELAVLAGYMRIIRGKKLLEEYINRIINIHPALLPSFPGMDAQKQAFEYGVKVSGATVHFVDASLDAGPIILQKAVDISECRNADEVQEKIIKIEHEIYPRAVDMFAKGKFKIKGRRATYEGD